MAVVLVNAADLSQAQNCLFLQAGLWVDKGSKFLREIDGLVYCHLSRLVLVRFHDVSQTLDISVVFLELININVKRIRVLGQLGQQLMKVLDTPGTEDLIKKVHLIAELVGYLQEALRELRNIEEGDLQVFSNINFLHVTEPLNDFLKDQRQTAQLKLGRLLLAI